MNLLWALAIFCASFSLHANIHHLPELTGKLVNLTGEQTSNLKINVLFLNKGRVLSKRKARLLPSGKFKIKKVNFEKEYNEIEILVAISGQKFFSTPLRSVLTGRNDYRKMLKKIKLYKWPKESLELRTPHGENLQEYLNNIMMDNGIDPARPLFTWELQITHRYGHASHVPFKDTDAQTAPIADPPFSACLFSDTSVCLASNLPAGAQTSALEFSATTSSDGHAHYSTFAADIPTSGHSVYYFSVVLVMHQKSSRLTRHCAVNLVEKNEEGDWQPFAIVEHAEQIEKLLRPRNYTLLPHPIIPRWCDLEKF